jgi:hypothetical protein
MPNSFLKNTHHLTIPEFPGEICLAPQPERQAASRNKQYPSFTFPSYSPLRYSSVLPAVLMMHFLHIGLQRVKCRDMAELLIKYSIC